MPYWSGSGGSSWTSPSIAAAASGAQQQGGGDSGWGWNPLSDFQKVVSGVGDFVDAHTQIGSFNPGIGHLVAMGANMVPALANASFHIGKDAVTGHMDDAVHELGAMGQGMWHGVTDTATDIVTAGGLAPWTNAVREGESGVYGYKPNTLKGYATSPGQGLGGALFTDAANIAMAADGAGALARAGEVGKAAEAAKVAETVGMKEAIDMGAKAPDVAEFGKLKAQKAIQDHLDQVAEAGGNPAVREAQIANRLKVMNRIDQVRTGASYLIEPWKAVRPFAKAAGELREEGIPSETPAEAPVRPVEAAPVPGAKQAPNQAQAGTQAEAAGLFGELHGSTQTEARPMTELEKLTQELANHAEAQKAAPVEPPAPGMTRLFNGGGGDRTMWTSDMSRAESYRSSGNGEGAGGLRHIDVPDAEAARLKTEPGTPAYEAAKGHQPNTKTDYYLGDHPQLVSQAVEHAGGTAVSPEVATTEAAPVGTTPSPSPATANFKSEGVASEVAKQLENVPRAYRSYIEQTKPAPEWVKNIVERLPEPMKRTLAWMDAHHMKVDLQAMTRQQQRSLAIDARRIEELPAVKDAKAMAADLVKERLPGVSPTVASNIVGQLINAYLTKPRELIEEMEGNRQAMEAAAPGVGSALVDSQLGYAFPIPPELNTPEFRDQVYQLVEPYRQLRLEASANMLASEFFGPKGLTPPDQDLPLLTPKEKSALNRANHKLNQALKLEAERVPKQLEGKAKEKAVAEDEVARAVSASQSALETMADARTDFDTSRYVPRSLNTPEKLAATSDELASRTIRSNGATYIPDNGTGRFISVATPGNVGYLVGLLPDSVTTISLAEFMDTNPETGRLRGAEILDNMMHGYQEAMQFPDVGFGVSIDAEGMVHIDPVQLMEGANARDNALSMAAAREQRSVMETHTGDTIDVQLDPNASAYFVANHAARDMRGNQLRAIIDKQIAKGGQGMAQDDIDRFMAFTDRLAVTQHLLHPDQYKSADAFYRQGFNVTFAERKIEGALTEARGEDILGQFAPSTSVTGGVIRLFKDADFATLLHEGGHLLRALTSDEDLKALERTYGVVRGKWTPEAEEAFTHDFLATAAQATEGPLSRLKDVLAQAYGDFGGTLHPEIDSFWQKTLAANIERVSMPGYELSTGEQLVGLDAKSELAKSMAQRQQTLPGPSEAETPTQTYKRGAAGQEAVDKWRKAARDKRLSDAAAARAAKNVTELEKVINERLVPAQMTANMLKRNANRTFQMLAERLEDPASSRVPAKWQPMVTTAKLMVEDIKKYPALEPILREFPQTFAQALDYAGQRGFDPTYMPDLTPKTVRDLIAGTARLGNQGTDRMGQQFESGARRTRRGTLQRLGAADKSIDALVAGINQVNQETRTNMVVDWIDRVAARDLPVNAAGRRLGAPTGWIEWDPVRKGMLALDKGDERIAVGGTKMIPRAVYDSIKEYAGTAPTNPFYRTMKTITDPWRALMLTLNPGFYLKHFQGHLMLAGVAGGLDLRAWLQAYQSARKGFTDIPEVTGQNIAFAETGTPGIVGYPKIREGGIQTAMQYGGPAEAAKYLANKAHSVIAVSDSFARAVAYFSRRNKGWTAERAAQYAMDAVVDYGNLSNTERYWVRSIIPFYSFEKGVAKVFYRLPIDHPVAAALMMSMSQWQAEQAVDDQGNPLPERYQGVVDLPLLGKVDMQKFSPFRDIEALTTPEGLVSSLQYAVQDVVRAGLGVAAPGTKAAVKVDQYGRLVPDVSLTSQLGASFVGGPQGTVAQSGDWKRFFGIPTVTQDTLNKAGQRNVLSQAELNNSSQAEQQKAAMFPVDTQSMQMNLQKQIGAGTPTPVQGMPMDQVQKLLNDKLAAQQVKSQATKAANKASGSHPYKLKKGGGRKSFGSKRSSGKKGRVTVRHFGHSASTRSRLRQGFGKGKA